MSDDDEPADLVDCETPAAFRTTVVKTGLATFCRSPALVQQIESVVHNATIIAFEGSKLLNLFFLYLLENKLPIPKLDRNWICENVYLSVSVDRRSLQPRASPCRELEFVRAHLYLPQRSSDLAWGERDYMNQILKQLSADTLVNCKNHVAVNFHKRLRRWWFGKLTRKLETHLARKDKWRLSDTLVKAACNNKTGFAMPSGIHLTVEEIKYLCNKLTELGGECMEDEKLCPIDPSSVSEKKLGCHVSISNTLSICYCKHMCEIMSHVAVGVLPSLASPDAHQSTQAQGRW